MQLRVSDLWRWNGTIDRGAYALWGCLLFALKYNLDRAVAALVFGRGWSIFSYLKVTPGTTVTHLPADDVRFYGTMVAMALPFVYAGIAMTVRRLRDAGLPMGLVALFFVPLVNLLFFMALAVVPGAPADAAAGEGSRRGWLAATIPQSQLGSAALGLLVTTVAGVALTLVAVNGLREYGFSLFVGLPFAQGLVAVLIYGYHGPRRLSSCLYVATLSVFMLGLGLLACAVEGFICLLMATPIGLVLALLGGTVGYLIQSRPHGGRAAPQVTAIVLAILPVLMGAESLDGAVPPLYAVTTAIEVAAPPERVWPNVIAFTELPPPTEWVFHTGIAYPIRARILGSGVGAVRRCEFTTGPFVEPITAWEPPNRLAFDVVAQPRSMNELSPYGPIHAPHIDHFMVSERGEFRLVPLPGGHTRLEGTTWYRHRIWPSAYWRVWSDAILHEIHTRVLLHVKALSEGQRPIGE